MAHHAAPVEGVGLHERRGYTKMEVMGRVNIRAILSNLTLRRDVMVRVIIATQAREGIETTTEQAERAYDRVVELRGL